jgi:hypothetical protein
MGLRLLVPVAAIEARYKKSVVNTNTDVSERQAAVGRSAHGTASTELRWQRGSGLGRSARDRLMSRSREARILRASRHALMRVKTLIALSKQTSIIECGDQFQRVSLAFVMIDEELRLVEGNQLPDLFH